MYHIQTLIADVQAPIRHTGAERAHVAAEFPVKVSALLSGFHRGA